MPRSTSGVYSKPAGTTAVAGTVISPVTFNTLIDDIVADLNLSRPYPWAGFITPMQFGAVGDGVTDDGVALNAAFAFLRSEAIAGRNPVLTGQGREYFSSISINATGIRGTTSTIWNWRVEDITIIGACAGKPVLDTIGTRGGRWDSVLIWGDKTNRPTVGWQAARAAAGGALAFCDNQTFIDCHVDGFFTVAARHAYGQESCFYAGCHWWNRDICGTTSIIVGHSSPVPMFSDYLAPMTGGTSMINNVYVRCEDRSVYWEEERHHVLTNISNTSPAVASTAAPHNFVTGEKVSIWLVSGMGGAFDVYNGVVGAVTSTTFEIAGFDATGLPAYSGGGAATRPQTKPTIIMGRCNGVTFHNHYFVNVGTHAVEFVFPDANKPVGIEFRSALVEGSPNFHVQFKAPGFNTSIHGFTWIVEQQRVHSCVIGVDGTTTGTVRLANGDVRINNALYTSRPMAIAASRLAMVNMNLFSPLVAEIPIYSFASFSGTVYAFDLPGVQHHGETYLSESTLYRPVISCDTGAAWIVTADGGLVPAVPFGANLGNSLKRVSEVLAGRLNIGSTATDGVIFETGSASPEGALTAYPGSYYSQTDGATAVLWFKKTGTGNTGWIIVA